MAGLQTGSTPQPQESVMFFTYKIPVSVVLLALLIVFFFATGQLP
jgi:hypothetical protein